MAEYDGANWRMVHKAAMGRRALIGMLASVLFLTQLVIADTAHAASGWSNVSGEEGITTSQGSMVRPDLIEYNGYLYLIWSELYDGNYREMHVMRYNGTNWESVQGGDDGCVMVGCVNAEAGSPNNSAVFPSLEVYDGKLFASWYENYTMINYQARVRQYDGEHWTTVDGGTLNVSTNTANDPDLMVYNDELYAIWYEANNIHVKKYSGDADSPQWNLVTPNGGLSSNAGLNPTLIEFQGSLHAVWREMGSGVSKVRVSRYEGNTNWVSVDEGGRTENPSSHALTPHAAVFNDQLHVIWKEASTNRIRVHAYDGDGWKDVSSGLNINTEVTDHPRLIVHNDRLYAGWIAGGVLRVKAYDGTTWALADRNMGLNVASGSTASYPQFGTYDGQLYAAWVERTGSSEFRLRVARMPSAPAAPTNVMVTPSFNSVTVAFDTPNDGGSPITQYTVTSSPEGITNTGTASPITITGLTYGVDYTFTVTATNVMGTSAASAPSTPITPLAFAPEPPTNVAASPGNAEATVSFDTPFANGSPITSYTVTSSPGNITATGSSSPITVEGLTNGVAYTFTVEATNAVGTSNASEPSTAVTPQPESFFLFDASTGTITGYLTGGPKDVVIPESIEGVAVTRIGNGAFKGKALTSVVIPDGVVTLESEAFSNNDLTTVTLPMSVKTIGENAFADNQLTVVTLYNRDVELNDGAFSDNQAESASLTLIGHSGTAAEHYATNEQHTFLTLIGLSPADTLIFPIAVEGYDAAMPQKVSITKHVHGEVDQLDVEVSGASAAHFEIGALGAVKLDNSHAQTSFTITPKTGLPAGTYTATVTVTADYGIAESIEVLFTVGSATEPVAIAAQPQSQSVTEGATVVFEVVASGTPTLHYQWQKDGVDMPGENKSKLTLQNVAASDAGSYAVVVSNAAGSLTSASAVLTVRPVGDFALTAVAGNRSVNLSWGSVTDAVYYSVYTNDDWTTTVTSQVYAYQVDQLDNGRTYQFVVHALDENQATIAVSNRTSATPRRPQSSGGSSGGTPPQPAEPGTPSRAEVIVLVNGKEEHAGTATTGERNGQSVTTIVLDEDKLRQRLEDEGAGAVITVPIEADSDVAIAELNGRMIKSMEDLQAVIEIRTGQAAYTLPAALILIDELSERLGANVSLQDIKVKIEIGSPTADTLRTVDAAADKGGFTLVAPPLHFKVTAEYNGREVELTAFQAYVERELALPEGVDPNRITTGVVIEQDGTVRHVPTQVVIRDSTYYARINSLTNSTYAVVWNPVGFKDVENHWAQNAVNNMGSRMVVSGVSSELFDPNRNITRAEFAAIIVRGLGLRLQEGHSPFADVQATDWHNSAIRAAHEYKLIQGIGDGTFLPNENITREQAMVIIANAMKLTGLSAQSGNQSPDAVLHSYEDAAQVSSWAYQAVADNVQAGIITGRSDTGLAPQAFITRAEVAAIVERLLQISELI
ncbi:S-layer homology domain-containing protein [Xylanibacillus composti]|uniref:S-layer family protein n=1 Tax=Xylanibacillus composti TaxID=1572762 RepID=A0A8J4H931_9BACL|nr:S-layer homology domain-containing protein [Xylanibacillus composti]GIQ71438.1 hypothetical protein XYCOK13_42620 [Xylanibacillus composti]